MKPPAKRVCGHNGISKPIQKPADLKATIGDDTRNARGKNQDARSNYSSFEKTASNADKAPKPRINIDPISILIVKIMIALEVIIAILQLKRKLREKCLIPSL